MGHERFIIDKIKEAREVRGMPIAELARRPMVESTQLAKVLRYERSLKPGECPRVCYALDMNITSAMVPDEIGARLRELNMRAKGDKLGWGEDREPRWRDGRCGGRRSYASAAIWASTPCAR